MISNIIEGRVFVAFRDDDSALLWRDRLAASDSVLQKQTGQPSQAVGMGVSCGMTNYRYLGRALLNLGD